MATISTLPGVQLRFERNDLRASVTSRRAANDAWYTDIDIWRVHGDIYVASRTSVRDGTADTEFVVGGQTLVRQFLGNGPLSRMAIADAFGGD